MRTPDWVCPVDHQPFTEGPGQLGCQEGHVYPVINGIPRFVADDGYAEAFGRQWLRFATTQLDSRTGLTVSQDRLRRCLGEELWHKLPGARVLECGCGAGRFTEILLARGADVTSIDLSQAVDANAASFPPGPDHRLAQASVNALPFRPRGFDIVLCIGVLQHTPSPEATLAALYEHVAPGGSLVVDCYAWSASWLLSLRPLCRRLLLQLPPARAEAVVVGLGSALLPLHRRIASHPWRRRLLNRVSPMISFYNSYPSLDDDLQREWALLDTHDALTDRYKWRRSPRRIRRQLDGLGASEIVVRRGGNGVEARAARGSGR